MADADAPLNITCTDCGHQMTTRLSDWPDAVEADDPYQIICPRCGAAATLTIEE